MRIYKFTNSLISMKQSLIALLLAVFSLLSASAAEKPVNSVGTLVRDTILGVPCRIYLPCRYAERTRGRRAEVFPVLYLQHGMYGMEDDWVEQGFLLRHMDSLLRAGEVREMVIIMPDNCPGRPTPDEERANATNGQWEGRFSEFMTVAEQRYRIRHDADGRAIAGLSMGGYHTMRVASLLDGQFAYVAMFSPATFVHQAPSHPRLFWLAIGTDDFLWDSFQSYRHWLDENHIEYTYYQSTGGHTWPNWQDYLCRFLPRLFR